MQPLCWGRFSAENGKNTSGVQPPTFTQKTRKNGPSGPKVVPKGVPKSSFWRFSSRLFFHLGSLWPALASFGGPGSQNDPKGLKMEPGSSQKWRLGHPRGIQKEYLLSLSLSLSPSLSLLLSLPVPLSPSPSPSLSLSLSFSVSFSLPSFFSFLFLFRLSVSPPPSLGVGLGLLLGLGLGLGCAVCTFSYKIKQFL